MIIVSYLIAELLSAIFSIAINTEWMAKHLGLSQRHP